MSSRTPPPPTPPTPMPHDEEQLRVLDSPEAPGAIASGSSSGAGELHEKAASSQLEAASASPAAPEELPLYLTMPRHRKAAAYVVLCTMTLALTYCSTAYASSIHKLEEHYQVGSVVIYLGVSLFVLGFGLGPLVCGPLATIYGKRSVYNCSFLAFTAFSFGASETNNVGVMLAMRFLAGASGSSSLNNVPASLADITDPTQMASTLIYYALAAFGGPGVGPVIAAFIDERLGWRWNLRVQAIFVACTTLACILLVPTTERRPAPGSTVKESKEMERRKMKQVFKRAFKGPFVWLIHEPVVAVICLYLSVLYGILYCFFNTLPVVFIGVRGFSPTSAGLVFISLLLGFLAATLVAVFLQQPYEDRARARLPKGAMLPPEARFQQALWAASLAPVGLILFAWTAPFPNVHWVVPCIGMALFALSMMTIFTSLIPYLAAYAGPRDAPLALAAGTTSRAVLAASFPLFCPAMFRALTLQGAVSLLAGCTLVLVPVPWVLRRAGPRLRARSRRVQT